MTDEEMLKEIDRREKQFAAAKYGRGLQLVNSLREQLKAIAELHQEAASVETCCSAAQRRAEELVAAAETAEAEAKAKTAEARKLRSRAARQRLIAKDGERLQNHERLARARFAEKLRALSAMADDMRL